MKSIDCVLVCIAVQVIGQSSVQAESHVLMHTRLTQTQAIQTAQVFCKRAGIAVGGSAETIYPAPDVLPESPLSWQPRWQVTFANQVKVQLTDATGSVCKLQNYNTPDQHETQLPPGNAISKEEAIEIARALMRDCGQISELATPNAVEEQISEPPTRAAHEWMVTFPRVYRGIPYKNQQANVLLQAETGEPVGFAVSFTSPVPEPTHILLNQATAVSSASALMNLSLAAGAALDDVKTEIVQPNTFWQPKGSEKQKVGNVKIARVVIFKANEDSVEVWLDVETGEVIGGTEIGTLSGKEDICSTLSSNKKILPIQTALQNAREIRIYKANQDNPGWHLAPMMVLNVRSHPKLFNMLRIAKQESVYRRSSDPSQAKIIVIGDKDWKAAYDYSNGYAGSTKNWIRVSTELQAQLK